jgi:hypothetical protein
MPDSSPYGVSFSLSFLLKENLPVGRQGIKSSKSDVQPIRSYALIKLSITVASAAIR